MNETLVQDRLAAREAGLRYLSDTKPGITREPHDNGGFRYRMPDGTEIVDETVLGRIKALAIPPAYTDVWISPLANSHLQATARDSKGRKQYRYHPKWRSFRDENKYGRMIAFGDALPKIRERVEQDLKRPGLPREKVLATIVRLLETTFIRIGNEQYAHENEHYGLTTLHNEHVDVAGTTLQFHFVGKSGKAHHITLKDRRLAQIVAKLRDLPGEELFEFTDHDGNVHTISSQDVNNYLHEIAGQEFSAKDFRTWAGTILAALAIQELDDYESKTQAKKNIVRVIQQVSERLGNTPSVCRKCYIHPAVLESYMGGIKIGNLSTAISNHSSTNPHALRESESAIMEFLQRQASASSH